MWKAKSARVCLVSTGITVCTTTSSYCIWVWNSRVSTLCLQSSTFQTVMSIALFLRNVLGRVGGLGRNRRRWRNDQNTLYEILEELIIRKRETRNVLEFFYILLSYSSVFKESSCLHIFKINFIYLLNENLIHDFLSYSSLSPIPYLSSEYTHKQKHAIQ